MKTIKKLGIFTALALSVFAFSNFNFDDSIEKSENLSSVEGSELASIDWTHYNYATNSDLSKCGDDKKKTDVKKTEKKGEHKCGEGKCGDDKKATKEEHKCGEGKCGDDKKATKDSKETKKTKETKESKEKK